MDGNQSESAQAHAGKTGKRPPRSIRFYDSEWERIETFAEQRGLTATEFVRFATLAAVEGDAFDDARTDRLTPLMERTFRYCYVMATKLRNDMHGAGTRRRDCGPGPHRPQTAGRVDGRGVRLSEIRPAGAQSVPHRSALSRARASGGRATCAQPPSVHSWRAGRSGLVVQSSGWETKQEIHPAGAVG